jgi:hypothetical protein
VPIHAFTCPPPHPHSSPHTLGITWTSCQAFKEEAEKKETERKAKEAATKQAAKEKKAAESAKAKEEAEAAASAVKAKMQAEQKSRDIKEKMAAKLEEAKAKQAEMQKKSEEQDRMRAAQYAEGKFYSPAGNVDPLWKMQMAARKSLSSGDPIMKGASAPAAPAPESMDPDARRQAALLRIASDAPKKKVYKWAVRDNKGGDTFASYAFDELRPHLMIETVHWEQDICKFHEDYVNRPGVLFCETTDGTIVVVKSTQYPATSQFFTVVASTLDMPTTPARILKVDSQEGVALYEKLLSLDKSLRAKDLFRGPDVEYIEVSMFVPSVPLPQLHKLGKAHHLMGDPPADYVEEEGETAQILHDLETDEQGLNEAARSCLRALGKAVALDVIIGSGMASGIWEADTTFEKEATIKMGHYVFAKKVDQLVMLSGRAVPMDPELRKQFIARYRDVPAPGSGHSHQTDFSNPTWAKELNTKEGRWESTDGPTIKKGYIGLEEEKFAGFEEEAVDDAFFAGVPEPDDPLVDGFSRLASVFNHDDEAGASTTHGAVHLKPAGISSTNIFGGIKLKKAAKSQNAGPTDADSNIEFGVDTVGSDEYAGQVLSLVDRLLEQWSRQEKDARGAVKMGAEAVFASKAILPEFEALRARISAVSGHTLNDAAVMLIEDGFVEVVQAGLHTELTPTKLQGWLQTIGTAGFPDMHLVDIASINMVLEIFASKFRQWQTRLDTQGQRDAIAEAKAAAQQGLVAFKSGPVSNSSAWGEKSEEKERLAKSAGAASKKKK